MTKEERYDIFERYLRGDLNGLEQKELESQLASDATLREELELHRGLHQAIGDKKLDYFAELVQESETNYFDQTKKRKVNIFQRFGRQAAAISAILVLGLLGYFFLFPKPSSEELFATYFEPYQAPGTFRSEDLTALDNDFILALARYDAGQYADAAGYFTKTLEKNPTKDVAVFLRGVSHLAIDSLALAEVDLKAVVANEESLFQDQARWYLGLVYLKMGDEARAEALLRKTEAANQKEVEELIKIFNQ